MSSDLGNFGLTQMLRCSQGIRTAATGASSIEAAAQGICRYLYDEFVSEATGDGYADADRRQCALVRFYVTHQYAGLDLPTRRFADGLLGNAAPLPGLRCLCLLGTAGSQPEWNSRRSSRGHRAIPMQSAEVIEKAPMIAQLLRQFGLDINAVVTPSPEIMGELLGRTYGVFHVEEAAGSPYIPAQADFVQPHGIRSVVGFGGAMRNGDIFATILFSRVAISRVSADRFRTLALDVKSALFHLPEGQVFEADAPSDRPAAPTAR